MIKFIKDLWTVYVERAKARKAVRVLTKQAWSVEFLLYIVMKATRISKQDCHVVLKNKNGQEVVIYAGMPNAVPAFNKLEESLDIRQDGLTWESVRDAAEVHGLL